MKRQLTFDAEHDYSTREAIELTVTLRDGDLFTSFEASIDTGSTFCIFKRGHAETLHLVVEAGTPLRVSTATGTFTAYGHTLMLETLTFSFETTVYFAAHEGLPRNVLGRRGWLNTVQLGIVDYEGKLYVSRYDEEPE
ncbi:MAG TPA: aspartyl protease family protein [Pyrinomonadaceae bacterium]|nr:aspartyl protease family protein [Pyrinomonadaceae bacterium]